MEHTKRQLCKMLLLAGAVLMFHPAAHAQAASTHQCLIAALHKSGKYRTDVVTNCRINTQSGAATLTVKGKPKTRNYAEKSPLTSAHIDVAERWLARARMDRRHNPAAFDVAAFFTEASRATSGFVLTRQRKGRPALNIVYITDGVYRSIDLPGSNLRAKPVGLLTTGRNY